MNIEVRGLGRFAILVLVAWLNVSCASISRINLLSTAEEVEIGFCAAKEVDTDEVNAFVLPGGWSYVNAGLTATADTEGELAGVTAHEIGHVVGRHGARRITTQFGMSILFEIVAGAAPMRIRSIGRLQGSLQEGEQD